MTSEKKAIWKRRAEQLGLLLVVLYLGYLFGGGFTLILEGGKWRIAAGAANMCLALVLALHLHTIWMYEKRLDRWEEMYDSACERVDRWVANSDRWRDLANQAIELLKQSRDGVDEYLRKYGGSPKSKKPELPS